MTDWSTITDARDVTEELILEALPSRAAVYALLQQLGAVMVPGVGAPRLLSVFARMASPACSWLVGALRIDVVAFEGGCAVDVHAYVAGGRVERILPPVRLGCRLEDLLSALELAPELASPLLPYRIGADRLALSVLELVLPPPVTQAPPEEVVEAVSLEDDVDGGPELETFEVVEELDASEASASVAAAPQAAPAGEGPAASESTPPSEPQDDERSTSQAPTSDPSSPPVARKALARIALKRHTAPPQPVPSVVIAEEHGPRRDTRSE